MVFDNGAVGRWKETILQRRRRPGRNLVAALTVILIFVATILTMVCVFAGTNSGGHSVSMLTVNAKDMGAISLKPLVPDKYVEKRGILDTVKEAGNKASDSVQELGDKASDKIDQAKDTVKGAAEDTIRKAIEKVQQLINDTAADIREDIGISDAYCLHMLNYCRGPSNSNGTTESMNCTQPHVFFYFDPAMFLTEKSNKNNTDVSDKLTKLGWPDFMDNLTDTLYVGTRAMFVFYVIAIVTGLCTIVLSTAELFVHRLERVDLSGRSFEPVKVVRYLKAASGAVCKPPNQSDTSR